jgi:hypothetical protein
MCEPTDDADRIKDFLVAEYARISAALSWNEELGERRVQFFTGLVTAFFGGVALLATAEKGVFAHRLDFLASISAAGSLSLLLIGLLTYDRLLKRDETTKEYQDGLDQVRRCFVDPRRRGERAPDIQDYEPFAAVPAGTEAVRRKRLTQIGRLSRVMILLNALLAGALGVVTSTATAANLGLQSRAFVAGTSICSVCGAAALVVLGQVWWWRKEYRTGSKGGATPGPSTT